MKKRTTDDILKDPFGERNYSGNNAVWQEIGIGMDLGKSNLMFLPLFFAIAVIIYTIWGGQL